MKRAWIVVLVVAITLASVLIAKFKSAHGTSAAAALGDKREANKQIAPDFELQSLDGKTVHLSDFRGKAVLLNFWATWCQPCKIEMPWFEQLQKRYAPEGLQVIGVAMDDAGKEDIANFAKNLGVDYPILLGKESVGDAYGGVQFLPATFYVARDGRVVDKVFGLKGRGEIEGNIKKALGP
jgi:thiol-disulfide isomerase/thioredoxin